MIAGKRITALAIFLEVAISQILPLFETKLNKKNLFQIILLFSLKKTCYFG